jgi:hypothetical protein
VLREIGVLLMLSLAALAGCTKSATRSTSSAPIQGLTLLRQNTAISRTDEPGVVVGALGLVNGCITDTPTVGSASYLVFPPEYHLRGSGSSLEVVDGRGNAVSGLGDHIRLSGSAYDLAFAEQHIQQLPEACRQLDSHAPHDFWFVT